MIVTGDLACYGWAALSGSPLQPLPGTGSSIDSFASDKLKKVGAVHSTFDVVIFLLAAKP